MDKINEKFINKCINTHGYRFDYSNVNYVNSITEVEIKCIEHNIVFMQKPVTHIRGSIGCKKCSGGYKYTYDELIVEFDKVQEDKYKYKEFEFKNLSMKIDIECPEHGIFKQSIRCHMEGQSCPKCASKKIIKNKTYTNDKFISKAKLIHGDLFDYSKVNYVKSNIDVEIICNVHGSFIQKPYKHLIGHGCQKCHNDMYGNKTKLTLEEFIYRSNIAHNNKYDYSCIEYINTHDLIEINCLEHGKFKQRVYDHMNGHGCLQCALSFKTNKDELEIETFLNSININYKINDRKILNGKEVDFLIKDKNIGIEYNGLYWHSDLFMDNGYHLHKTENCLEKNIQLIHIFEDEWLFKNEIVKSRLANILNVSNQNTIYGRKCKIRDVDFKTSSKFLNENHLQGMVNASIRLGLYFDDELVSLMTFNKPRNGIGGKYVGYELSRFCSKINTNVIGGASKLFKYFIKNYEFDEVISYADRRWSNGDMYLKLGFELSHINKPTYQYIVGKERKHRMNYTLNKLKEKGLFVEGKTEKEITKDNNIHRIYDCGTLSFKYKKQAT